MKTKVATWAVAVVMIAIPRTSQHHDHLSSKIGVFIYPEDYNKRQAPIPNSTGQKPLIVLINMDLWSISEISLLRQDIEVDLIMTIAWYDMRLTVTPNISADGEWARVGAEFIDVWRPTLMFRNCKGCLPVSVGDSVPLFVHQKTGRFWAQHRILTKFSCAINLRFYPMDIQNCAVQLYTNEHGHHLLVLQHNSSETYTQISSGLILSEFNIPSIEKNVCTIIESSGKPVSCIELDIKFIRRIAYHFITSYSPTTFIVIISWISFWIPVDAVPARVALGLTSLLTLATRLDEAQANLPPVSYVKAIDVWMFACIFLVSVSLIEFAVSQYISRQCSRKAKRTNDKQRVASSIQVKQVDALQLNKDPAPTRPASVDSDDSQLPQIQDGTFLDRTSRVLFPVFFSGFNIVYWSYYLS